jgi:hypothetical protein
MAAGQKNPKLGIGFKKDSTPSSSSYCSSQKVSELKHLGLNLDICLQNFKQKSELKFEFHFLLQLNLELKFFFFKKNGKEREEDSLVSEACVV